MLSVSSFALASGDVVKERQAGFKQNVDHIKAIKAALEAGDGATIATEAEQIAAFSAKIPDLFPKGSDGDSRAKAEIWSDWDDFVAKAKANGAAASALAAAAKTGDMDASKAALDAMGKTCGACHDAYRVPKT